MSANRFKTPWTIEECNEHGGCEIINCDQETILGPMPRDLAEHIVALSEHHQKLGWNP